MANGGKYTIHGCYGKGFITILQKLRGRWYTYNGYWEIASGSSGILGLSFGADFFSCVILGIYDHLLTVKQKLFGSLFFQHSWPVSMQGSLQEGNYPALVFYLLCSYFYYAHWKRIPLKAKNCFSIFFRCFFFRGNVLSCWMILQGWALWLHIYRQNYAKLLGLHFDFRYVIEKNEWQRKPTLWTCISFRNWGLSNVMLVFRGVTKNHHH